MGHYSLILTMGVLAIVGTFTLSSRDASQMADGLLADNTYKNVAREASVAGLNMTLRRLVADTTSWVTNPSRYTFTDQSYQNAVFSAQVTGGYGSTVVIGRCVVDTVDVVSTAVSDGGRTHELRATVVRTCSSPGGTPPFFRYVTISEDDLQLAGSPSILSTDADVNADIHTNKDLEVSAHPLVEGFGSYVVDHKCAGSACDGFVPNVNPAGSGEDNVIQTSYIQLPLFVPSDYAHMASYTSTGSVNDLAGQTIDFTNFVPPGGGTPVTGYGTEENPFLWYIQGDFSIKKKGALRTLGHGIILTEGDVHINSQSHLYSSVPAGMVPPTLPMGAKQSDIEAIRDWFGQYQPEGTTLALYAGGAIHNNGKNLVMAQLYANGKIHINGLSHLYGAAVTRSRMKFNGSNVAIWFAGANTSMELPGMTIVLPDGIRLIAYSEW